ncbi:proton-activated chloride channel [Diretmus argenteus]
MDQCSLCYDTLLTFTFFTFQLHDDDDDDEEDDDGDTLSPDFYQDASDDLEPEEPDGGLSPEDIGEISPSRKFSKTCLKNVFTVVLISIYLMLTTVAAFLAYQAITDFLEKLKNPVMSVTYKEVDLFPPPGIALYPGKAQLLSCKHHYHAYIPPLVDPGKAQEGDCVIRNVTYMGPFTNQTKRALVVRGPSDVRNKELIFMQFSHNETEEDFSSITYMLFAKYSDLTESPDKAQFMMDCERNYSTWTFSGGFRTWVKMSLAKTSGKSNESIEFRQESSVVQFNDRRPEKTNQLYFVVFEWRDPFMQEIKLIVTANPWNTIAILCGVFMALFKAANFAKLSVMWIIKMRKRHLRSKTRELNQISAANPDVVLALELLYQLESDPCQQVQTWFWVLCVLALELLYQLESDPCQQVQTWFWVLCVLALELLYQLESDPCQQVQTWFWVLCVLALELLYQLESDPCPA